MIVTSGSTSLLERREARAVVINALSASVGGGLSVARSLSASLSAVRPHWRIRLLHSHPDACPNIESTSFEAIHLPELVSPRKRWIWEQLQLPAFADRSNADAILLLGGFMSFGCRTPQISVWQNAHLWSEPTLGHSRAMRVYIRVQRFMMMRTVGRVDANVFLSQFSRREFSKRFGHPTAHPTVVPLGIDDEFLESTPRADREARSPIVLAVGDLYPHKRFEMLIRALVTEKLQASTLRLVIAGRPIDEAYARRLRSLVEDLSLEGRVTFLGGVPREKVLELYDSSLLYVTASGLETFGLTPAEAMARGLPVIASASTVATEICEGAALYFDDTADSLGESIARLARDAQLWKSNSEAGRILSERYSWRNVSEQYARLIERTFSCDTEDH